MGPKPRTSHAGESICGRGILASVSRENVELVRRMYDAYARGEFELGLSYLDPEIEFSQPVGEPGAGTYHGHEGVLQAFANWTGAWDDYQVEVEHRIFQLWTLRHDKVVRARMYYDEAEALEAAGLRQSDSVAGE